MRLVSAPFGSIYNGSEVVRNLASVVDGVDTVLDTLDYANAANTVRKIATSRFTPRKLGKQLKGLVNDVADSGAFAGDEGREKIDGVGYADIVQGAGDRVLDLLNKSRRGKSYYTVISYKKCERNYFFWRR